MTKKLNTTLGFYSPSFIRMYVGTKRSLQNLNTLNDPITESIYLHEYTHFIQDITTTYGLINICIIVDYMKFANNHTIQLPVGDFQIPVKPVPNGLDNVDTNLQLARVYNGTGEDDIATLLEHRKIPTTVTSHQGNLPLNYIEIDYVDSLGQNKTFEFGALCIVESMAYIIESECYPNCPQSPDLPYSSAEKLVNLIYPQFGRNRLNVLALCDASLKHFHPGEFFYDTLLRIQKEQILIIQPEDIYQVCNLCNQENNFNALLQETASQAISQIQGYFNDPFFQRLKDWLENMMRTAVDYRLINERFPLDIARGGNITNNNAYANFLTKVGTPLVTNELGETTLHDPRNNSATPDYTTIWAIDLIHSIFWGWQRHCEMVDLCHSGNIPTDMRCTNEPWGRASDQNLCPFAQMWRHWGLTGYYPK